MGLFSKYPSIYRLATTSRKHLFSKTYPSAFNGKSATGCQQWVHTESLTSEKTSPNEEMKPEQPVFVDEAVPHDVLVSKLLKCSSLKEQMVTLVSVLGLSPEDVKQRHSISAMISDMVKPFFHDYSVQLFGSSVNGLGFKGCDIDMGFLTMIDDKDLMRASFDDSDIPTIEDVLSGRVSPTYMSQLSSKDQLLFIHTVFLDYYTESTAAPIYINAFVPIIRFVHDAFQLKIDLSAGNKYGFYNSKLLYLFGKLDDRINPLLMTIRYWAKNGGLIGGGLMFNTYCLTLLAVFFLQTRNPPVLPSIEYILNLPGGDAILSVDMSDYSFLNLIEKIPPTRNTESLESLLREFFFYYLYFDYEKVASPRKAKCISRSLFMDTEESKKFKFNTICVQDPIKLTHNVANLVHYKNCRKFARDMLYACHLFHDRDKWTPQSGLWGLAALFSKPDDLKYYSSRGILDVKLPLKWFAQKTHPSSEYAMFSETAHLVVNILEKTLAFNFKMMEEARNYDFILNEGDEKLLYLYKCMWSHDLLKRSNIPRNDISTNVLENSVASEREVSSKSCQWENTVNTTNYNFMCRFYACKLNGEQFLTLKFASAKDTVVHPFLGVFLKEAVPKMVRNQH